ncbi:hypothetical protein GUJ93_ZPchr0002g24250 [Zizania palustris]|uniref:Uncharacterized protein n=1 Tax=Zizania palustris TaxID=103762 RepID=A0A8J5V4T9_ZIZPA|nr:hypothetical protein GUJ93_ZPchr0002g24250 [Zizania palustris]
MKRLLVHPCRSLVGKSSAMPALCNSVLPRFVSTEKDKERVSAIGEKARSTAEQFLRVAKEKTGEASENAKEKLHETKEAVVGGGSSSSSSSESDDKEKKLKQRAEEGKRHQN